MIAMASTGVAEGYWLRAERQSGGRGRVGRTWVSPAGNLYTSTIVRVRSGDPAAATLALVAAVALDEIVRAYAPESGAQIKWPNDIMVGGAKLAGILLERSGEAVVIGIGANLAEAPTGLDRPVTSLSALGFGAPDPDNFVHDLAASFARWVARWRGEGLGPVREAWLSRAHPTGTALSVGDDTGLFDGLAEDGALRLRLADGQVRVIHAGDVFLV